MLSREPLLETAHSINTLDNVATIKSDDNGLPPRNRWLSMTKHPAVMPYFRWFMLVTLINAVLLYNGLRDNGWWMDSGSRMSVLNYLVLGNFTLAILIRQHHVVNLLFRLVTSAPTHWPLAIRWALGKVYHFGGLHTSGAILGTAWFAVFTAVVTIDWLNGSTFLSNATLIASFSLLGVLIAICLMALPHVRSRFHNSFELSHRLGGWTALALFWVQTVSLIHDQNLGEALYLVLLTTPAIWMLIILTVSIALPWLRLKKVAIDIASPSSHVAVTRFDYGVKPFAGSSTAISRSPLREWHSFANIPSPHREGFRLTISRAGDWTGSFIDDKPSHVWVKAIPTAGVGNIDKLFKRVLWVATGSGIGPCLPHLLAETAPANLIWSTRNPNKTYGDDFLTEIKNVQSDSIIWDTDKDGKPNMVELTYEAYLRFKPEAIICISNKKLTYQVVYEMESRGIPAFGAIWDS